MTTAATIDPEMRRRLYAEEIEAIAALRTPALVAALATVRREAFLRAGPWIVRTEADFGGPPRATPDADPRHVYHNLVVAIDPARQLFNGQPSLLAMAIDSLALAPAARALHVGCGLGYYTALMAQCVGPGGRVVAIEADETLAREAAANLAPLPWVEVRHGEARDDLGEPFDAILVNAGVTHPLPWWLDALAPAGRIVLPLTGSMKGMGATIGKGLMVLLTKREAALFDARVVSFVAIYLALGIRDEALGEQLGRAMAKNPFPQLKRLRRDTHEPDGTCWLHTPEWCLS